MVAVEAGEVVSFCTYCEGKMEHLGTFSALSVDNKGYMTFLVVIFWLREIMSVVFT